MAAETEKVRGDEDALRADIDKLRADLSTLAKTLSQVASEAGSDAVEHLRTTAYSARAEAGRVAGEARARGERAAESVGKAIEERPLLSLVTAFVIGLLLGVLFGRHR